MKRSISLLSCLISVCALGQGQVESKIERVTVYKSGATIERVANVSFTSGRQIYLFEGVPDGLNANTIQLTLPEGVSLINMDYRFMTPSEMGFGDLTDIGNEIDAVHREIEKEEDNLQSYRDDLAFISNNSDLNSELTPTNLRLSDNYLSERRRILRTDIRSVLDKIQSLQETSQRLRSQMAILEAGLGKPSSVIVATVNATRSFQSAVKIQYFVNQASWKPFYNIRTNDIGEPVEFEFMASVLQNTGEDWENVQFQLATTNPTILATEPTKRVWTVSFSDSYVPQVHNQESTPHITQTGAFHAIVKDGNTQRPLANTRVELIGNNERFVSITNESGEVKFNGLDVGQYKLISRYEGYMHFETYVNITTAPNLNRINLSQSGASQMITFNLEVVSDDLDVAEWDALYEGETGAQSRAESRSTYSLSSVSVERIATPGQEVVRNFQRTRQALGVLYTVDEPFSVPSTGLDVDTWISTQSISAEYIERIRPTLSDNAFLIVKIDDWEELDLLPGTANFFVDNNFNGSAQLDPKRTGDTLELAMGVDPAIACSRQRTSYEADRKFWSGKVEESYGYTISIRNTRNTSVDLSVQEQIPVSVQDDIAVFDLEQTGAVYDAEIGLLTWQKVLEPGEEWTITYSFKVRHRDDFYLTNLPQ